MSRLVDFLRWQGGFSTRSAAIAATSRAEVDSALESGEIVWISRGRYGLPEIEHAVAVAHGMNGVLSHASAALWHGWELKSLPGKTHVTLPRRRRVGSPAPDVCLHKSDLGEVDVVAGICTSVVRTLVDCLRTAPGDEALAIADSALRHGVSPDVLSHVAATVRGPGRPGVLRALRHADGRSANPFESCLRSIAIDAGLDVTPQRLIVGSRQTVRPDLVDAPRRLVLEADSFEWHGARAALKRDARRYNLLVIDGWLVLRFAYEDVMYDREYVLDVLQAVVDARTRVRPCPQCAA